MNLEKGSYDYNDEHISSTTTKEPFTFSRNDLTFISAEALTNFTLEGADHDSP
jgi:hypothetical protein